MKQIKNVTLAVLGGLLILSVATVSCKKKSSSPAATITTVAPNPATTGATVTITGTNFAGTATVSINGGAAIAATVVNGTTITFVAPAATTGALVVTVNGTPIAYTGGTFTVNAVPVGPTSDSVETAHLLAKWTFDANSQEAISQQAAATTVGTVTYTSAGQIGNCATFTAGALVYNPIAQISIDTALESYSVSAWVKMPTATGSEGLRAIFDIDGNRYPDLWGLVSLELNNNGVSGDTLALRADQIQVDGSGVHQGTTGSNYAGNGGWTFITETYDGSGLNQTLKLYANGNMIDSTQFTTVTKPGGTQTTFRIVPTGGTPTPIPANDVTIGTFAFSDYTQFQGGDGYGNTCPTAASRPWAQNGITGQIDDIRLFNTAITQADITALYNYGSQGK